VDFGSSPAASASPKKTTPEVPAPAEPAVEPEPAQ